MSLAYINSSVVKIQVDENISLQLLEETQAESLLNVVNANRNSLRDWLPWVDHMRTVADFAYFINDSLKRAAAKTDFGYAIIVNGNIVGRVGLHHINHQNRIGEVGYWLAADMQGKGIMMKCCKAIIEHAFKKLGLNRLELKCATTNDKSRAIAEKLQFKREGILHEAELLNGKFINLYLYAMLKQEWYHLNA